MPVGNRNSSHLLQGRNKFYKSIKYKKIQKKCFKFWNIQCEKYHYRTRKAPDKNQRMIILEFIIFLLIINFIILHPDYSFPSLLSSSLLHFTSTLPSPQSIPPLSLFRKGQASHVFQQNMPHQVDSGLSSFSWMRQPSMKRFPKAMYEILKMNNRR